MWAIAKQNDRESTDQPTVCERCLLFVGNS